MKLIYCRACQDIMKLTMETRYCACGRSWGKYLKGGSRALISSTSVPLAIENIPFDVALQKRDETGESQPFKADVIHKNPRRITEVDGPPVD